MGHLLRKLQDLLQSEGEKEFRLSSREVKDVNVAGAKNVNNAKVIMRPKQRVFVLTEKNLEQLPVDS